MKFGTINFAESDNDMKTDKEIRAFMHGNRPASSANDAFMADFVRQIELLPVPASFEKEAERQKRKAEADVIAGIFEAAKVRNRKMAVLAAVAVVAVSLAVASLLSFVPDSWVSFFDFLPEAYISPMTAKYLLMGFFVMVLVALAGFGCSRNFRFL